jgi:hypothetical protein
MPKQLLFRNFYQCYRCNHEWEDVWSATCDDDWAPTPTSSQPGGDLRHLAPYAAAAASFNQYSHFH